MTRCRPDESAVPPLAARGPGGGLLALGRGGRDDPEMAAAAEFAVAGRLVAVDGRAGRLTDRLGEGDQVIGGGRGFGVLPLVPDHVPRDSVAA